MPQRLVQNTDVLELYSKPLLKRFYLGVILHSATSFRPFLLFHSSRFYGRRRRIQQCGRMQQPSGDGSVWIQNCAPGGPAGLAQIVALGENCPANGASHWLVDQLRWLRRRLHHRRIKAWLGRNGLEAWLYCQGCSAGGAYRRTILVLPAASGTIQSVYLPDISPSAVLLNFGGLRRKSFLFPR